MTYLAKHAARRPNYTLRRWAVGVGAVIVVALAVWGLASIMPLTFPWTGWDLR